MNKAARQKSENYGRGAERIAILYLQMRGYRCLARRVKTPFGEIDLIMRKGQTLVFAEVKYRRDKSALNISVRPSAQKRIINAAHYVTSRQREYQTLAQRFDLILIAPRFFLPMGLIRHMKDAWRTY